jgi:hypothetical protein
MSREKLNRIGDWGYGIWCYIPNPIKRLRHSVFPGRLILGLEGNADFNRDGFITAEESNFFVRQHVYDDVKDVVRGHPIYKNVEQTPQYGKWFGEGEFIFRAK